MAAPCLVHAAITELTKNRAVEAIAIKAKERKISVATRDRPVADAVRRLARIASAEAAALPSEPANTPKVSTGQPAAL